MYKIKQNNTKHKTIYAMIKKMEPKEHERMWYTKKPYKQHTSYDLYIFQ